MATEEQITLHSPPTPVPRSRLKTLWLSQGIRTRIITPILLLMALSLIGSLVGYLLSTAATRNRIIDEQLDNDSRRIAEALALAATEATDAANLLARSPDLASALERRDVLDLDRQALIIRDRFRIDQVLIVDGSGRTLVNITAQSALSRLDEADRAKLQSAVGRATLLHIGEAWLLVGSGAISTSDDARVYTVLNVSAAIDRYRRELGLRSDLFIPTLAGAHVPRSANGVRSQTVDLPAGDGVFPLQLSRSEEEFNAILGSGLQVVLGISAITLLLMLFAGLWMANSVTRPILKLSRVAAAVAAGDLSARANFIGNDEIGQLGAVLDDATTTISQLLNQRARAVGESRAVLESIADGVLAIDSNRTVIMINPAAAAILDRTDLAGRPLTTLTALDDEVRAAALQPIVDQISQELIAPDEKPTEQQVGLDSRVLRLRSAPIVASGQCIGAVVVLQDITAAVEADRAKTEFIATASHELRTPLASIRGYVDLFKILGQQNLSDEQRSFLDVIRRQTDHMTQLVNDLLEVARIERGAIHGTRSWLVPSSVIDEVVQGFNELAKQRQIDIQIKIQPDLPRMLIDPSHLRRILTNLVSNGLKYTPPGGQIWIRVDRVAYDGVPEIRFEVEDTGVGIKLEDQDKIFNRFFRSENPLTIEAGGTGLGLTITKALVEHNHGAINFTSAEGKGTCFRVRLPVILPTVVGVNEP